MSGRYSRRHTAGLADLEQSELGIGQALGSAGGQQVFGWLVERFVTQGKACTNPHFVSSGAAVPWCSSLAQAPLRAPQAPLLSQSQSIKQVACLNWGGANQPA